MSYTLIDKQQQRVIETIWIRIDVVIYTRPTRAKKYLKYMPFTVKEFCVAYFAGTEFSTPLKSFLT